MRTDILSLMENLLNVNPAFAHRIIDYVRALRVLAQAGPELIGRAAKIRKIGEKAEHAVKGFVVSFGLSRTMRVVRIDIYLFEGLVSGTGENVVSHSLSK